MHLMRLALVLLLLAPSGAAVAGALPQTFCVKPGGGDGCFATIQGTLGLANPGDVVRVAAGTYVGNVDIDENVTLEGGWNTAFTVRDPAANETIIEPSDATFSVVSIEGGFASPAASTPVLDGFTIRGGRGDLGGNHGGGIRIRDSHATVRSCVVTDNRAFLFGGGIWVQRGAPRIESSRIEGNVVEGGGEYGGGIEFENAQAVLVDTIVRGNATSDPMGSYGAGIAILDGGPVHLRGGAIEDNHAPATCAGNVGFGGGIAASSVTSGSPAVLVEGVRFSGNCAGTQGDALWLSGGTVLAADSTIVASGGGVAITNGSDSELHNLTLSGAGDGIGVLSSAPLTLTNSIVTGFAQGVFRQLSTATTRSNLFWNNAMDASFPLDPSDRVADPLLDATLHLGAGSPAIDGGQRPYRVNRDVDGDPRVMDGGSGFYRVDIGADELAGVAQRNVDLAREAADLTIVGPGQPPENPGSIGTNDWIGRALLASDVSGDGLDDLVVSAQDFANDFNTNNAGGRLFGLLHFGARATGVRELASDPADFEVTCSIPLQHMGEELVAGDLDDDGALDLVVGAADTHADPTVLPKAFALFGGSDLATGGAAIASGALGDFAVLAAETSSGQFASVNALATGDLTGDGVDDLVVGDSSADSPADDDDGAAYLFFGGPAFGGVRDLASAPADATLFGFAGDGTFGAGPYAGGLAIGDLDGDGQADLAIRDQGFAYVAHGPFAAGPRAFPAASDTEIEAIDAGGVLVMDLTGDGADDLLLDSAGSILVFAGPLARGALLGPASAALVIVHDLTFAAWALAAADVLGDARLELLVGEPIDREVFVVAPRADLSGTLAIEDVAPWVVTGSSTAIRNLGFDVTGGDLDGDQRDDLVVGSWGINDPTRAMAFQDVGKAFVFYGESCGDGQLGGGDVCDDGAFAAGDGCTATCTLETDHACVGEPSACGLDVARLAPGNVSGSTVGTLGELVGAQANLTSTLDLAHDGLGLSFWLSLDGTFGPGDREIGSCALPLLAPASSESCSDIGPIPVDLPLVGGAPTFYRWLACVTTAAGRRCTAGNQVLVPEPEVAAAALAACAALGVLAARRR